MQLSHLQKLVAKRAIYINFIHAPDKEGVEHYCYFAVWGDMMLKLHQDIRKNGGFDPKDYGIIIKEGVGFPSLEVIKEMEEKYQYKHEQQFSLLESKEDNNAA